ncbi:ubiquitin-conjugating enzyme E2 Z isoform X2 [Lithobates pipiens]
MAESPATEAIILPGAVGGGVVTHLSALQPPGTSHLAASSVWDPTASADWDNERASAQCVLRIKRDIMSIYKEPPPGMFVVPDPHDMTKIHALITGPFDTPYEGGFFLFLFRCPPDYPIHPPRVKLMTTGNSTVRFNPNFYRNGKVCLSILGRDTQETARTTMSAFVTRPSEWQYVTCWKASASVQRPYGPLWRNRFWNIMIFMKQFAKTDFIYKDRACRIHLARSEGILTTSLCSAACSLSSKEFGRNTGVRLWI